MSKAKFVGLSFLIGLTIGSCSLGQQSSREEGALKSGGGLVGAWIVSASRPGGVGKNMLTFSSDGTFFRSGDTHPVLSVAHGAWKRVGDNEYDATYIAFRFDQEGKWIGSNKTRIRIVSSESGNDFKGVAKVSTRDLQDNEISTSESRLEGKRIPVEPF